MAQPVEEMKSSTNSPNGPAAALTFGSLRPLSYGAHKGGYVVSGLSLFGESRLSGWVQLEGGFTGKVCVIGGSAEFTGAPYFAAAAALRLGADLAFVLTTPDAAPAIKSYSPELIVYPILAGREDGGAGLGKTLARLRILAEPLLRKSDAIVIGPGLGGNGRIFDGDENPPSPSERAACVVRVRQSVESLMQTFCGKDSKTAAVEEIKNEMLATQAATILLLSLAIEFNKFLVIDADCLRILSLPEEKRAFAFPGLFEMLRGYKRAILTPNFVELRMILQHLSSLPQFSSPASGASASALGGQSPPQPLLREVEFVRSVAAALEGPCVLHKGSSDVLAVCTSGNSTTSGACIKHIAVGPCCGSPGAPKRSGGQGDLLCGVLATLIAQRLYKEKTFDPSEWSLLAMKAMHEASWVVRKAAAMAFERKKRSMGACDILEMLGDAAQEKFHSEWGGVTEAE